MRTCVLTFFGQDDTKRDDIGLPIPFFRYVVFASEAPGRWAVASVMSFRGGPEPAQMHYAARELEAAVEEAVKALMGHPRLKGLGVDRIDRKDG